VSALSGGNRQKVVLARWLETRSRVLMFDEPTAGVDVGARHEIHTLLGELAAGGCGVIVVSSDLDELLAISGRIVVMREGRIAGELGRSEATRGAIMTLATA
jgi:ABC-type sugar transport system ATPase subunit